jgi:nucleotide-binding universal stress UspA family protein
VQTQRIEYDLVVIGAVHKGQRRVLWKSAKAYEIIKRIVPPVLVVMGERTTLKRILICSGGKSYIDRAVQLTGRIARAAQASVTLVHAMAQTPVLYTEIIAREEDVESVLHSHSELGRNLRAEKETLEAMGVATNVRLRQGPVASELLEEIRTGNYDLVVTGFAKAQGPVHSYLMGDVTRDIVNQADVPVLVVRASAAPKRMAPLAGLLSQMRGVFGSSAEERKQS